MGPPDLKENRELPVVAAPLLWGRVFHKQNHSSLS